MTASRGRETQYTFLILVTIFYFGLNKVLDYYNIPMDATQKFTWVGKNYSQVLVKTGVQEELFWVEETELELYNNSSSAPETTREVVIGRTADTFANRRNRVRRVCKRLYSNANLRAIRSREFIVNDDYKLIWCNIFKAASTTWFYHFGKLAGWNAKHIKKSGKNVLEFIRHIYPEPTSETILRLVENGNYSSFLIVREPFERLVSVYSDKINQSIKHPFYSEMRCEMTLQSPPESHLCLPTFSEFIDYILDGNSNEHWEAHSNFCTPCLINYKYILHFENLRVEEVELFNAVDGLSSILKSMRRNFSKKEYNETLMKKYFGQLSLGQLNSLIKKYIMDFLLFGYSWDKYYGYISS